MYLCCSDDPKEMPAFVASNEAADGCTIKPYGDNIFAAIWYDVSCALTETASILIFYFTFIVFIFSNVTLVYFSAITLLAG